MALTVVVTDGALIGSDEVEFIFGVADLAGDSENQIAAAGGGDLVLADAGLVQVTPLTVHNNTTASAVDLDDPLFWTRDENPLFGDAGIPHTTALVELTAAESEVFSVTAGAGQTITVDIDMKDISNASGAVADLIVELVDAAGNVFAMNNDSPVANGGLGSFAFFGRTDSFDPFLTFTAPAAGRYFIVVRPRPFTFFADSAIVLLNVSVTGHAVTTNTPMGDDTLNGGAGDDRLFGQGGNDIIDGGTGADLIHGGSGADLVHGGEGNDTLHTGGNGQYFGDAGNDLIVAGLRNAGTQIIDGGAGLDTLDTRAFNGDYIIDLAAGTSNIAGESFTGFEGVITGDGNDIASGTSSGDNIHTSGGNDRLDGLAGDDTLSGGAGNDVLNGGNGNDTADYTRAGSGVTAQLNSNTSTRDGDGGTDTFSSIENLTGSFFDDTLIGDGGANRLSGGAGADTLIGLGGDDFLFGGGGALNTLQGGLGNDHYLLAAADSVVEFAGEGIDTVEVAFVDAYTLAENVENLIFRPGFNARGTGNSAANVITGAGGDDVLRGRGGADVLNGGAGSDTADYTLAAAGVVVRIDLLRATNDGDGSTDTYTSIENAIGSNFNDVMFGDGNANLLQGGIGSDILIGGGGNDTLMGGSGGVNNQLQGGTGDDRYILDAFDTIVELAGEGIDTVESRVGSYTLGANVENLFYTGPGSFVGTGNALNNVITGGARNDILRGGGGNDTINGGLGTDELQLRGVLADYAITVEGAGYRIIDRVAGRDGSTFVDSVEVLRFANNTIRTLAYPVAGALLASEAIGAGLDPDESPIAALDRLFPPTGDRMLTLDPDIGLPGQPYRDFDWMM